MERSDPGDTISSEEGCLSEGTLALLVCGGSPPADRDAALAHLDSCAACRELAAELARAGRGSVPPLPSESPEEGAENAHVPPGATIGRYVVLQRVGAGGMGVVYAAYDPELDRRVALKLVRPRPGGAAGPSATAQQLASEAKSLARVSHPNVVAVYDVETHGELVAVVMEFVEGSTLRVWLGARRRTPRQILSLLSSAGAGLAAAHEAGIVHRDVKPENVLVGTDGRARITDFGLALTEEEGAAAPRALAGTLPYMAPEQLRRARVDGRSDQFAFAVMLFEALYGRLPYEGATREERLASIRRGLTARVPLRGVSARVGEAVIRALAPDPEERFASMNGLLRELAPPARGALGVAVALGALAIAVGGTYGLVHERRVAREALCRGAEHQLVGVWDEARRSQVREAFLATPHAPFDQTTLQSVERTLDAYAAEWARTRVDVCEATRVRGEQSEALLDDRMGCLDDRKRELAALVDEFSKAAPRTVETAVKAANGLSTVASCANRKRSPQPYLASPEAKARSEALRGTLAEVRARLQVGDVGPAQRSLAESLSAARELGDSRLLAQTHLLLGTTEAYAAQFAAAEQSLLEAVWAAESSGDDDVAARAFLRLVNVVGNRMADQTAGARYERYAEATLARLGSPRDMEAELLTMRATRLGRAADYAGADGLAKQALTLLDGLGRGDTLEAAACWNIVAVAAKNEGRRSDARAAIGRTIDIRGRLLGALHPDVSRARINLATIQIDDGLSEEALATLDETSAALSATTGEVTEEMAMVENDRGIALTRLRDFARARAEFEAAVNIYEKVDGPDHPSTALAVMNVADADRELGDFDAAFARYDRAQAMLDRSKSPNAHTLARILAGRGQAQFALGQAARAKKTLEEALIQYKTGSFDPTDRAEAEFALARALRALREDDPRQRELAASARAAYAASLPAHRAQLGAVERWLAV